jgi:hypothetical protein
MIDGTDANLAQIEAGMAWWYRKYQSEQKPRQRVDYEARLLRRMLGVDCGLMLNKCRRGSGDKDRRGEK